MLILDKRKAVEHMVALTAQHPDPAADESPGALHGRRRQNIATFERRTKATVGAGARRAGGARPTATQPAGGVSMA